MPAGSDMRRYGSTSSINRSGEFRLSSNLNMSYDGFNQSTPDLSNAHTRTSSVDSYEDSHGSHSRQSSDSVDIPTRTIKSQRKVSQSEDPLKFIKLKPSNDLAKQAEEQITLVQEVKHVRKTIEREEEDWQSNLSSWKSRRRRVSAAAIERVEGTDDLVKSDGEKKRTKTFDQIKQEREKRKSVGQLMNIYPIEDDKDLTWNVKVPPVISETISKLDASSTESAPRRAPMLSSKYRSKSMGSAYSKSGVAEWAESDEEDNSGKSKTENKNTNYKSRTFDENHNAEKSNKTESGRRLSNKFSNIMKSFESKQESDTGKVFEKPQKSFEFSVDSESERFKGSKVLDTQTARSTLEVKKKLDHVQPRNYIEKDIKIKQKSHNPKGFGIIVVGGQDKKQPVVVEKVNIGSAADVCEVQMKDEIISINNRDIGIMTQAMVRKVIEDANRKGELELRVRRYTTVESDQEADEDDDAFYLPSSNNSSQEPESVFSTKATFEPSRTSSKKSESPAHHESPQRSRTSYQPSPLSRSSESPSSQDSPQKSRSLFEVNSRKSDLPQEPTHSSRLAYSRTEPEDDNETLSQVHQVITTTTSHISESLVKREEIKIESSVSPVARRRRQRDNTYGANEDTEEKTSIMSELDREKQWIMEQMKKAENFAENVDKEETDTVEEEIIPRSSKSVESSYTKSNSTYGKTEDSELHQTLPSHEEVEEKKPTIRVHRSRQKEEETSSITCIREIPTAASKPVINNIDLTPQLEPRQDQNNDLSPASQSSGGFGPPEILKRWQRPRPRSDYSSNSSINDDNKRLSTASLDSTASSPRFPEDDISQNHFNGSKTQVVVGQPVTVEFKHEQPSQQTFNMAAPQTQQTFSATSPSLVIDPRNRGDNNEASLPQYNFHFNINDRNTKENEQLLYDLEAEREKIRQEEKEKMEKERRQQEEAQRRRLQEKEARLREEEEEIQRKKQELEEIKASMEREKMELSKNSDNRYSDQNYSYNDNKYSSDRHQRSRPDSNHQFSAYADSNSTPRSLGSSSSSWRSSHQNEVPHHREHSSRDDVLMNRSAKPFSRHTEKDSSENYNQNDSFTKENAFALNYSPKHKIHGSQDWIQNSDSGSKQSSRSESPNEHWLVEEAERRRKSGHHSNYQSGPIKPKSDNLSNRWQNDRYSQPPRSLSPQNTKSNEYKQFSARPQSNLNQTLPANFSPANMKSKPQPPVPPKPSRSFNSNISSPATSTQSTSNLSSPVSPSSPKSHAEQVVAVSGKQLCSHCSQELGFGAAMVIESLGLYYHVQCFKCCVCHAALGSGNQGADVRVRVNKLHCRNCYSNDEAGLKFSKV